jgi:hypothetical protein
VEPAAELADVFSRKFPLAIQNFGDDVGCAEDFDQFVLASGRSLPYSSSNASMPVAGFKE